MYIKMRLNDENKSSFISPARTFGKTATVNVTKTSLSQQLTEKYLEKDNER